MMILFTLGFKNCSQMRSYGVDTIIEDGIMAQLACHITSYPCWLSLMANGWRDLKNTRMMDHMTHPNARERVPLNLEGPEKN
jgi:hypothetical protein